jgi:type VI secretion system protein ImpM
MSNSSAGFFGKIPARGDFVRAGLTAGFIAAWDGWLQRVIPASRALLGEDWLAAWLEAPVWRFALEGGTCGADAVLGLWMPSVDRAGRHFPLTLAIVVPGARAADLAACGAGWLDAAEAAGREAVAEDAAPERIALGLASAPPLDPLPPGAGAEPSGGESRWWTEGAPRVAARNLQTIGLPGDAGFAAMLDDRVPERAA